MGVFRSTSYFYRVSMLFRSKVTSFMFLDVDVQEKATIRSQVVGFLGKCFRILLSFVRVHGVLWLVERFTLWKSQRHLECSQNHWGPIMHQKPLSLGAFDPLCTRSHPFLGVEPQWLFPSRNYQLHETMLGPTSQGAIKSMMKPWRQ